MTSYELQPESAPLPESQRALITPEFQTTADRVIEKMMAYSESGGQTETPEAIIQTNAYSDLPEAERDEFMRRLGERLNRDVDGEMTASERDWRQTELGESGKVWLEPWMKQVLKLSDPEEAGYVAGVQRQAALATTEGQTYWVEELEMPTGVMNQNKPPREMYNRIIWLFQKAAE